MDTSAADPVRGGRLPPAATVLGIGGGPLGGLFRHVPEEDAVAAVERAWGAGLRLFDVAPLYGHGRAERLMGAVLRTKPRASYVLSTKVGRLLRERGEREPTGFVDADPVQPVFDYSADGVRRSLEESLVRLGVDRVDVVLIHDPEQHLDQALVEAQQALVRLRDEGMVGAVGVGTNFAATVARFAREADIDCALLAGRITLLEKSGLEEALPLCAERGISVVAGGVFNSGILADASPGGTYDYARADDETRGRVAVLRQRCAVHGVPLTAAALRYPLRHAAVSAVVVGVRSADEVDANVAAFATDIPDALWAELDDV
ncbi:MAG TPA: aldo/keto reductase [Gaiellaceae bacterium]